MSLFHKSKDEVKTEARILDTIQPSSYLPAINERFRVRYATIADRSYMDVVFQCLGHQDGAVIGKVVHGRTYGATPYYLFVVGDVLFYCAEDLMRAVELDRASAAA